MKTTTSSILFLASLFAVMPLAQASTTVLLDENFPDGLRKTQNLPTTSAWYASGNSNTVTYTAGALTVATDNARFAITYFTNSGSPVSLGVGESLSATFNFSLLGASAYTAGSMRIGLFNSTGSRISADGLGGGSSTMTTYQNYAGYAVMLNPNSSTSTSNSVRERITGTDTLITSVTGYYNSPFTNTSGGGPVGTLADSVVYTGVYTVTRVALDTVEISLRLSNGATEIYSIVAQDTSSITSLFDTFVFDVNANTATSFTLNSVDIVYNTVPEPGAAWLIVPGLLLAGLISRKRSIV